jgi:hypothetical protein
MTPELHPPTTTSNLQTLLEADVAARTARQQQNLLLGFLAGFMALLVSTGLWVTIAAATGCRCTFLAPGLGFLVGGGVQFFGRGVIRLFAGLSTALTALGCTLAPLFTACAALAASRNADFWSTVATLQPRAALTLLRQGLAPVDALFFLLALGLAWKIGRGFQRPPPAPRA